MTTQKELDRMVRLARSFAKLYKETGFISILNGEIHVRKEVLGGIESDPKMWTVRDRKDKMYPVEVSVYYKGVRFYALLDTHTMGLFGIVKPEGPPEDEEDDTPF